MFRRASVIALALAAVLAPRAARAQLKAPAPEKIAVGSVLLSPSLELRTRSELRRDAPDLGGEDGYGRLSPRVRTSWNIASRARLGLGAERGPLRAQLTFQDARTWGSPVPTAAFPEASGTSELAPYEAYMEARSESARPTFARLGRQAVVWGEGRLLGSADFGPRGRSLDALRVGTSFGELDAELLAAMLEPPRPAGTPFADRTGLARSGAQLFGALLRRGFHPLLVVETYALARVARGDGTGLDGSRFASARVAGEVYTGALRVSGSASGWSYAAEGAYQVGRAAALAPAGRRIAAWAAAARVEKAFDEVRLRPTLEARGSYASGDRGGGSAYRQFDPLLGDPQRFHGPTDLFGWSNLVDVGGGVSVVPFTEARVGAHYRYARLAERSGEWVSSYLTTLGRGPAQGSAELGHEISARLSWRPWAPLELAGGYAGLLLGDGARAVMEDRARGALRADGTFRSAPVAHYAYAQATLRIP